MEEIRLPCDAFRKNQDGSWTTVKPISIKTGQAQAQLSAGQTFNKGAWFAGINLAMLLDEQCG